jgi:putative dimethyl sulfoxide reductase chaperone
LTPYESVYRTGLMLQEPHFQVRQIYQKAGVEFTADKAVNAEDHISGELGFMQHMSLKESRAWKKFQTAEATDILRYEVGFLEEHLTLWIEDFSRKVEDIADIQLFDGIAKMAVRFINMDYNQTADLLEKLEEQAD